MTSFNQKQPKHFCFGCFFGCRCSCSSKKKIAGTKYVRIYLIEGSIKLNLENENNPLSVIFNSGMTDNVRNESVKNGSND